MKKTSQIDVTKSTERVSGFFRRLPRMKKPVEIVLDGLVVGRLLPPGELSEAEKASLLRRGREIVQKVRTRTHGLAEKAINTSVAAAVKRVRARQ